jgi:ABC-2 type transport system ATP-binding protein
VQGLTKKYGKYTVFENLDLELPAASLVGLLGPNGAGKSTLMKMLAGLIVPDAGLIRIAGYDLRREEVQARSNLAYVPDVPSLYSELTVLEHLELIARAHYALDTFRVDAEMLLQRFGLWEARDSPTYALSRGMSQKLALSGALIRPSQVLLLDEPGSALDIASLDELYMILADYRRSGGMALLSSHQWETLQGVCDRFVLMNFGAVAWGELQYLRRALNLHEDATLREVYLAFMRAGGTLDTVLGPDESWRNGR